MGDNEAVILYDRRGTPKVILPAGTTIVRIPTAYPTNDETTYICPDGDIITVDRRERKIRNVSKGIELADY